MMKKSSVISFVTVLRGLRSRMGFWVGERSQGRNPSEMGGG